jgi:hypothetical protein
MRGSLLQITTFIEPTAIPHNHVDPQPLVSVEATGICITICNSEVLLAAVYKSPGRAWSDADITKLLSFGVNLFSQVI